MLCSVDTAINLSCLTISKQLTFLSELLRFSVHYFFEISDKAVDCAKNLN